MSLFPILPIAPAKRSFIAALMVITLSPNLHLAQLSPSLDSTSWQWIDWTQGGSTERPLSQEPITLMFKEGKVSGFGGCNNYFSTYQIEGDRASETEFYRLIMSDPFGRTFKACGNLSQQEDQFLEYLGQVERYQINSDGELYLFYRHNGETGQMRFRPISDRSPAQTSFTDIPDNYWAQDFITVLVERNLMSGFADGTFRPDTPVTRAEFASLLQKTFDLPQVRKRVLFRDVPQDFWAQGAIQYVATTIPQLMGGYPGDLFRPEEPILRVEVLVSLANLLREVPEVDIDQMLTFYEDRQEIPDYALEKVAIATQHQMAINYPKIGQLRPNQPATRAEVAALIYQGLVKTNLAPEVESPYRVNP
jgi:heat shock protein HslJ